MCETDFVVFLLGNRSYHYGYSSTCSLGMPYTLNQKETKERKLLQI